MWTTCPLLPIAWLSSHLRTDVVFRRKERQEAPASTWVPSLIVSTGKHDEGRHEAMWTKCTQFFVGRLTRGVASGLIEVRTRPYFFLVSQCGIRILTCSVHADAQTPCCYRATGAASLVRDMENSCTFGCSPLRLRAGHPHTHRIEIQHSRYISDGIITNRIVQRAYIVMTSKHIGYETMTPGLRSWHYPEDFAPCSW